MESKIEAGNWKERVAVGTSDRGEMAELVDNVYMDERGKLYKAKSAKSMADAQKTLPTQDMLDVLTETPITQEEMVGKILELSNSRIIEAAKGIPQPIPNATQLEQEQAKGNQVPEKNLEAVTQGGPDTVNKAPALQDSDPTNDNVTTTLSKAEQIKAQAAARTASGGGLTPGDANAKKD